MAKMAGRAPLVMALAATLIAGIAGVGGAGAAEPATGPVQVEVQATGPTGVGGVVLLSPSGTGTAVQVLAVGAPSGTTAVVHPGRCDVIDATLVALLGDVSVAGQLQTTVPVPFETLTDGGHVIVFHPGLDLATAVGCGAIPATAGNGATGPDDTEATPEATPTPVAPPGPADVDEDSFSSERFGFSITWGEEWQRVPAQPQEGLDFVSLSNSVSQVHLGAYEGHGGDASACVAAWERRVIESLQGGRISAVARVDGPDGQPIAGGDATRSRAGYSYTAEGQEGAAVEQVDILECRRLSTTAVLEMLLLSPGDQYAAQVLSFDALLAGLSMPAVPEIPDETPPTGPTPVHVPTPEPQTPAPVPTADPSCLGVPEWAAATTARLDRLAELLSEAERVSAGMDVSAYVAAVATVEGHLQDMIVRQSQGPVPDLASEANRKAIQGYEILADAARQIVDAVTYGDLVRLQRAVDRYQEGDKVITDLRREIGQLQGRCAAP